MVIGESKIGIIKQSVYFIKMSNATKIQDLFVKLQPYSIYNENDLTWRITKTWVTL